MAEDIPTSALHVGSSSTELLATAVRRLTDRIGEVYPPLAPGGGERAEAYLRTIQAKLEEVVAGTDPAHGREWLARSPLFEPLMSALAVQLIRQASSEAEAPATLAVLRAWVELRGTVDASAATVRQEAADELRAHMRGPGAFELLVEVAHDFRSPLTSILFLAEALRDGHSGPVNDAQRSQLGLIYSAAFGLASVASDVMDLARGTRDLIGDEPEPYAPAELFRNVERMVRPLVEEKGLEFRVVVPERWRAHGHPRALSRVLLNLVTNALKFTDSGRVELGVRPLPHGRLEYYVQDTGRGMTSEQRRLLFQPFKRRTGGGNEGHYFSGSGIGLSIARRLLGAMGSELRLDSSDETGTRFSFDAGSPRRQ